MNFNNIRNVGYPKHNEDAVPRSFVDDMVKTIEEKVQKVKEKSEESPFFKENEMVIIKLHIRLIWHSISC